MRSNLLLAAVSSTTMLAGCVVRPAPVAVSAEADYGTVYVQQAPPAPIMEVQPAAPAYGYVWVDGYWDWTGATWSWMPGYWAPPRQGYAYVRPTYVYDNGRYVYRRGYWNDGHHHDYHYAAPSRPIHAAPVAGPHAAPGPTWRGAPPAAVHPAPAPGGMWRGAPPAAAHPAPAAPMAGPARGTPGFFGRGAPSASPGPGHPTARPAFGPTRGRPFHR